MSSAQWVERVVKAAAPPPPGCCCCPSSAYKYRLVRVAESSRSECVHPGWLRREKMRRGGGSAKMKKRAAVRRTSGVQWAGTDVDGCVKGGAAV